MLTRERASEPCVFKHVACSTHNDIAEDDHETTTTITMISRNSHRDDNSNKHVHNFGMCAVKHNMSTWVHGFTSVRSGTAKRMPIMTTTILKTSRNSHGDNNSNKHVLNFGVVCNRQPRVFMAREIKTQQVIENEQEATRL